MKYTSFASFSYHNPGWSATIVTGLILILICVATAIITSCGPTREEVAKSNAHRDTTTQPPYTIYTIEGHEYIEFYNHSNYWGVHNENCPNPIHKTN